jgi:hypothetical protein
VSLAWPRSQWYVAVVELRPAALRFTLEQGLPAVIEVAGRSMEPTLELGAKVDVAPLPLDAPLEVGDIVLIATTAEDVLLLHRVMHVFDEGEHRFVVHQGDAVESVFSTCARAEVLARMTGFAGGVGRPLPTPERLDAAARGRFQRRRAACAAYARARGLARRLGVGEIAIVRRCAAAFRKLARALGR